MRKHRIVLLAALAMTGCAARGESTVSAGGKARGARARPKPPLPGRWELVRELTDEFDSTKLDDAKLDATKWHPCNPGWKGRKPGFFAKENVKVRGGKLHLTARMEDRKGLPDGYHTYTTAAVVNV